MKKLLPILFVSLVVQICAQPNLYRHFPQPPPSGLYGYCDIAEPQKTSDNGYIFSFFPWTPNLHGPGPYDQYTIKTDSNFVPQWKKFGDKKAVILPTGGIILYYGLPLSPQVGTFIEKVTAGGISVWTIKTSGSFLLNDGISYNGKVRFVGARWSYGFMLSDNYEPYTLEIDTLGNLVSSALFNLTNSASGAFTKIKRDPLGNFFALGTNFTIAKFTSAFNPVWGKTWALNSEPLLVKDFDFLPNGDIFATGMMRGSYPGYSAEMGALLKFDSQCNILSQNYFDGKNVISGLCKKPNGNYVISLSNGYQDSLFLFETNSSALISWNKLLLPRATAISTPFLKNNSLYTVAFVGTDPVVMASDLNGKNCRSKAGSLLKIASFVPLTNVYFVPVVSSVTLGAIPSGMVYTQTFQDSCKCVSVLPSVIVSPATHSICAGNAATLSASGTGNILWYSSTGGSAMVSSPTMTYSSLSPTSVTLYVKDSICVAGPGFFPVTLTVVPNPNLSVLSNTPSICQGQFVTISVSGAYTYTWNSLPQPYTNGNNLVLNPSISTVYTVNGTDFNNCMSTRTISVPVLPKPPVSINPTVNSICSGATLNLVAIGAVSYTWNNGVLADSISVSPSSPTQYIVIGEGNTGCTNSSSLTLNVNTCLGLNEVNPLQRIRVSPNPGHDKIKVSLSYSGEKTSLELFDSMGKLLFSQEINDSEFTIDLSSYAPGVFYLNITGGQRPRAMKLVKQ